jgi:serine protease Do
VVVELSANPARDSIGALITAVTPGSPADKAGVHTGDIVVQFNDTRLARPRGAEEEEASLPGRRLIELASRLHTGDTVRLELRRDSRPVNVTVVAGESGIESIIARARPLMELPSKIAVPFEGNAMSLMIGVPLANLELVKVNPGLGEYFGTPEGILVVNAPGDSALGLRAGDVILSIGGRKPTSPSHAFRILGTYDPGESVSFELMRMKRHITVSGKMPEQGGWRMRHNSFDFDVQPGWDQMDLLRGWSGTEWPQLLRIPELRFQLEQPQRLIKTKVGHISAST